MGLKAEQLDILADRYVTGLYADLERDVISDIARRVQKTMRLTETAELQAKFMREQGYSTGEIQKTVMKMLRADKDFQREVAENTKAYKQEVKELIEQTVRQAKLMGNDLVAEAGDMAWNDDLQLWEAHDINLSAPNNLAQLKQAFVDQTNKELKNITRTTGFKNVNSIPTDVMHAYQREMDLATIKISTGTFSYDQAVKDCVHRLAASGLRSIDYANGRTYELETAARMITRTAASQLAGKISIANIEKTGTELVYVDAHAGARPEHAEWQGQVYSYNGKSRKYPEFVSATNYGDVTGLKGVNCSHNFFPYWEGDPIPTFKEPDPVKINGKTYTRYEANQEQRRMERAIRATKREIEASRAVGLGTQELEMKKSQQIKEYKVFSQKAGIRVKENRIGGRLPINAQALNEQKIEYMRNNLPKHFEDTRHIGKLISEEELNKFTEYANKKGVQIGFYGRSSGFETYCGNPKILYELVDRIEEQSKTELYRSAHIKKINLRYDNVLRYKGDNSKVDIGAYAWTQGNTITLNKFMFDDTDYMIKDYAEAVGKSYFVKGTDYKNIIDHEIGHIIDHKRPGLRKRIESKFREEAEKQNMHFYIYLRDNISVYAARYEDNQYKELLAEINSLLQVGENDTIINLLREVGVISEI